MRLSRGRMFRPSLKVNEFKCVLKRTVCVVGRAVMSAIRS